ncbi:MAG: hypothetical protein HY077_13870 [Elusimicrobia bacterium]|nr:hypothetical protein [Elusimicrobiota bacterium]
MSAWQIVLLALAGAAALVYWWTSGATARLRAEVRANLAKAGCPNWDGAPQALSNFTRVCAMPHNSLWQGQLRGAPQLLLYEVDTGAFWVVWQSKSQRKGALALWANVSDFYAMMLWQTHYNELSLIKAESLPKPYDALMLFADTPDGATMFFGTALGANFLQMLGSDGGFGLEYQDGWCRLHVNVDRPYFELGKNPQSLVAIVDALDGIVADDAAAVPYAFKLAASDVMVIEDPTGKLAARQVPSYRFEAQIDG